MATAAPTSYSQSVVQATPTRTRIPASVPRRRARARDVDAELPYSIRTRRRTATSCDVVFVGVESIKDLDRIGKAMGAMTDNGAIWVVHRKGPSGIADTAIFAAAKALGLTYTKVARVSDTHTAEKLVRPVASRTRQ